MNHGRHALRLGDVAQRGPDGEPQTFETAQPSQHIGIDVGEETLASFSASRGRREADAACCTR